MKRMKLFNQIMLVTAAIMMAACGAKEQKTILVGHFAAPEDAPEYVTLTNAETNEETNVEVKNGTFRHEMPTDKTTIYELEIPYQSTSFSMGFIPDCDTVRYEIGLQAEEFFSDPQTLNHKLADFIAFQGEVIERVQEDPSCYTDLMAYTMQMYEDNKDNYLGLIGLIFSSQGMSDDEWLAMVDAMSPEMQAKEYIQKHVSAIQTKRETGTGTMFKDFEAPQPDGTTMHFSDFVGKGKYVLVDFWASWCGPCIRETPYIRAAYDKYRGDNFDVLGVAVFDEPEETLKAISEHGIVWNVILNAQQVPGELYGFSTIPTIFLFGPDGTLLVREGLRGDAIMDTLAVYLK